MHLVPVTKPIPIRLGGDLISRLDDVASRMGTNRTAIVRVCVQTFVEHFEKRGKAALPPNWEELLAASDNRTIESRNRYPEHVPSNMILNHPSSGALPALKASVEGTSGAYKVKKGVRRRPSGPK